MRDRNFLFLLFLFFVNTLFCQITTHPLSASYPQYLDAKANSLFPTKWIPVGPVLNSARVEAVQAHPSDPSTMYVAFGSGNLWKTDNNGLTWRPIFENQPIQGIGDIAIAPSNPKVIYIGTGESLRKDRNFTMSGNGVYRSDDAGESWKHLGLEDSWHISEIVIHPKDPNIVFVAVLGKFWSQGKTKGIYRSTDGGKNWKQVLYVDENTRANDIVISPTDPNTIYASMWENNLDSTLMESVYGSNSGIYKSEDGGASWRRLKNGLPTDPKIGRIGLAVSHQDHNKIYALVDNRNNKPPNMAEVYRSVDGGETWKRTHEVGLKIFSVIGWYFADIYVNPKNDEEIFTLGVRMAHSSDGGKTFDLVAGQVEHLQPSPAQTLHLDHCELWIDPNNPRHLILGNDGGLYVSYDKGKNWLHHNNIPAGEFYEITLDNQTPYLIYGGTQDNATVFGTAKEYDPTLKDSWKYLWIDSWSGGDGCVTQVDPDDPNTVYFSMQNGAILRRDMKADTSIYIAPRRMKEFRDTLKYNFVTPYFISPHHSKTIYHGGNFILKTTDRGEDWKMISPDISISSDPKKVSAAAGAIAESKIVKGLLYAGTDHGAFWCSRDDGKIWKEFSKGLPIAFIRSIYPSRFKTSRVYAAMTGMNYDDLNKYIYVSENYGETWESISTNLPNEPVNVVLEDPTSENILYAGTHRGVYISMNRGQTWNLLGNDLPTVSIADLEIQERENELVVATHGRGIYFMNLNPIHELNQLGFPMNKDHLFKIPPTKYPKLRDTHQDIDRSTLSKIPFSFWTIDTQTVRMSILNKKKEIVFEKNIFAIKGLNQWRWNMVTEEIESDLPYFINYKKYIPVGEYVLRIKTRSGILEETFFVKKRR